MKKLFTLLTLAIALTGNSAYSATDRAEYYLRFYTDFSTIPVLPRGLTGPRTLGFMRHPHPLHAQPLHRKDAEHAHMNIYNDAASDKWSAELTDAGKVFVSSLSPDQQRNLILHGIAYEGAGMRRKIHLDWDAYRKDCSPGHKIIASCGLANREGLLLVDAVYRLFRDGTQPDFESFIAKDKSVFSMQVKAIVEAMCLHIGTLTASGGEGTTLSGSAGSGSAAAAGPGGTA